MELNVLNSLELILIVNGYLTWMNRLDEIRTVMVGPMNVAKAISRYRSHLLTRILTTFEFSRAQLFAVRKTEPHI